MFVDKYDHIRIFVTAHGFKGSGFRGSTNKDNVESHQWRETCERMKTTTLNRACRAMGYWGRS